MNADAKIKLLQTEIETGNQDAYRQLFNLLYPNLYRFAFSLTKNKELSEEIVSDVFINIWRKKETIAAIDNLKLYLYISAKNTSLNYLSKLAKEKLVSIDQLNPFAALPFSNPEQVLVSKEMNTRIHRAIEALPPQAKLIFILTKELGFSYKEAAALLNLSPGTIDNQLVIALKKLSKSLHYQFIKK